jgi:ribosome-binding protein aMBF1 (putative translation factor)
MRNSSPRQQQPTQRPLDSARFARTAADGTASGLAAPLGEAVRQLTAITKLLAEAAKADKAATVEIARKTRTTRCRPVDSSLWTWVDRAAEPEVPRSPGRNSRPWSARDRIVSQAVGAAVRRLRRAARMTCYDLAARLAVSQPQVSYIERGTAVVTVPLVFDLADLLAVPPAYFLDKAATAVRRRMRPYARAGSNAADPSAC